LQTAACSQLRFSSGNSHSRTMQFQIYAPIMLTNGIVLYLSFNKIMFISQ